MGRKEEIIAILSKRFPSSAVELVVKEYISLKQYYHTQKWSEVIIHSAIMCEAVMGLIAESILKISVDYNKINFNDLYQQLVKASKNTPVDEILLLAVPNVAKSIYTIRNKKHVAHLKLIDPNYVDAYYCSVAADWILSQLLSVAGEQQEEKKVTTIIQSILEREVPLIEEFEDGSVAILGSINLADAILLLLYKKYPERLTSSELANVLRLKKQTRKIAKILYYLDREKGLVHRDKKGGVILTKKGLRYVEESILNSEARVNKKV
jgi:hypothetical protein